MEINYYSILNLKKHCKIDDIHKAYAFYQKVKIFNI